MKRLHLSLLRTLTLAGLLGSPLLQAADWPQWMGPNRSGVATAAPSASAPLQLPAELKPLWRIPVGGGFSSPVLARGKLVYLDETKGRETVHLLEAASGKELWTHPFAESFGDEWGQGPRSTPTIDGERIFVQSCNGEFRCLELSSGKEVWGFNFTQQFGVPFLGSKAREGTASRRGNNGSSLVDESRVIVPVGSTNGASLVCFNKETGQVLWKSLNDEAAYSSPIVATLAGEKQIVAFTAEALVGVDRLSGKMLWRVPFRTNAKRHAATPVSYGDTLLVNSHSFGLASTRISRAGEGWTATEAWVNRQLKINLATPVRVEDFLYSQGPNRDFVCVDAKTGALKWVQPGFGKEYSATLAVGRQLLILTDEGQLVLAAADPAAYREQGRLQVCGKTWSFPAFADGRLYVRDGRELLCLDLR